MAFIDGTVVNVALAALQSALNATVIDVQWVVESYALFLAAFLLVGGSLGDRYGRKLVFAIGIALFAAASAWCGFSPNIQQLIVARAIQGIGGALLVPGSLAIIGGSFTEKQRGQAIGTWSGFTSITAAIGPLIGGWMIDHISWRAAFFINVPLAIVVLLIVFWRVPESRDDRAHHALDWSGAVLVTAGLGLLVYGLIESSRLGFGNPFVLMAIAFGSILVVIFLFLESKRQDSMLPLQLFRSKNFSGANLLTFFLYAALGGALFFYPLNLIQIQHYSSTAAGAAFLPFILIMFSLSRWSGGLVKRFGSRLPLTIGTMVAAIGFALFVVPGRHTNYWTDFFPAVAVLGIGMAISVAPLTTTVMNSVKQNQAGVASGVNNAVSRIAGLLAVAVFGIVMLQKFNSHLDDRIGTLRLPSNVELALHQDRNKLAAIRIPANVSPEVQTKIRDAIDDSFVTAFRVVFIIAAGLGALSSVTAWFFIQAKTRPAE